MFFETTYVCSYLDENYTSSLIAIIIVFKSNILHMMADLLVIINIDTIILLTDIKEVAS